MILQIDKELKRLQGRDHQLLHLYINLQQDMQYDDYKPNVQKLSQIAREEESGRGGQQGLADEMIQRMKDVEDNGLSCCLWCLVKCFGRCFSRREDKKQKSKPNGMWYTTYWQSYNAVSRATVRSGFCYTCRLIYGMCNSTLRWWLSRGFDPVLRLFFLLIFSPLLFFFPFYHFFPLFFLSSILFFFLHSFFFRFPSCSLRHFNAQAFF